MGSAVQAETPPPSEELAQVFKWRENELLRAGYPLAIAMELAHAIDVDLHRAVSLIQNGCPSQTAAEILL